jgi:hypothetical protein
MQRPIKTAIMEITTNPGFTSVFTFIVLPTVLSESIADPNLTVRRYVSACSVTTHSYEIRSASDRPSRESGRLGTSVAPDLSGPIVREPLGSAPRYTTDLSTLQKAKFLLVASCSQQAGVLVESAGVRERFSCHDGLHSSPLPGSFRKNA